jgi:Ca2+-dependent lipid-binding protein
MTDLSWNIHWTIWNFTDASEKKMEEELFSKIVARTLLVLLAISIIFWIITFKSIVSIIFLILAGLCLLIIIMRVIIKFRQNLEEDTDNFSRKSLWQKLKCCIER